MRITKLICVIFIFSFALCGCKAKSTAPNDNSNNSITITTAPTSTIQPNTSDTGTTVYKDGTYDIKHKSTKPGFEEAVVTILNGSINNIDLKRLDENEVEVNYDAWDGTGEYPNLKQYRIDLAAAMLAKQSPDVDAISGATQSSNGWKAAVTDALAQAKQ